MCIHKYNMFIESRITVILAKVGMRIHRSIARFLVLGGGGKTPKCTDRETYIYFQDSKYICLHIQSMQFPLLYTYGMGL